MAKGIDYAFFPHPSIASMKAAGITFVCRYTSNISVNDSNGKNLVPAEMSALRAAGFSIVMVFETAANRALAGHDAGMADATYADMVVRSLGMPGQEIYFAVDFDAAETDQPAINAYFDGVAAVITVQRAGIYGGYYPVKRTLDAGKAKWAWQTYAWSGGLWEPRAHIRQIQNGINIGGASDDLDVSQFADFAQFPAPVLDTTHQTGTVTSQTTGGHATVTSTDGGWTWKPAGSPPPGFRWQTGTVLSAVTAATAYVVSDDGGLTWHYAGTPG